MKDLPQAILDEQIKGSTIPAVKVVIQDYDFPTCTDLMRFNKFTWEKVYSETANIYYHGLAFDTNGKMHRVKVIEGASYWEVYYQGVSSPDMDSTYTSWTKIRTTEVYDHDTSPHVAIAACGTEISVVTVDTETGKVYYAKSDDAGANWGEWSLLMTVPLASTHPIPGIAIAYKTNGDVLVSVSREFKYVYAPGYFYWISYIINRQRLSGVWQDEVQTEFTGKQIGHIAIYHSGTVWYLIADMDGDFWYSRSDGAYWAEMIEIEVTSASVQNLNIMKFQPLSASASLPTYIGRDPASTYALTDFWDAVNFELAKYVQDFTGHVYVCYDSSLDLPVFSLVTGTTAFFITPLEGTSFADNTWTKTIGVNTIAAKGLALAIDSNYIWATASAQIWRCPLPKDWTITAGSGAGDTLEVAVAKIIKVEESVDIAQQSSLDITFDNSDDYFDSPGAGALTVLSRGSRINLYLGFTISDSATTSEYARYFVDDWEYNHEPNRSRFVLHCLDAWGLLNKFTFPHYIEFNVASNEYSIYAIIAKLNEAIGGTLTYLNRSSSITTIYPRIEIHPNDTAGNLLRRLLVLVPDQIRFFGNDGTIVYPQSTDTPIYYYAGPA